MSSFDHPLFTHVMLRGEAGYGYIMLFKCLQMETLWEGVQTLPPVIWEEASRSNYGVCKPGKRCRMAMI